MAQFRYNGEIPRPTLVVAYGNATLLSVPCPSEPGGRLILSPPDPPGYFVVGDTIPGNITNPACLRAMRADPRFTEIL